MPSKSFRSRVARLALEDPELKPHLVSLLRQAAGPVEITKGFNSPDLTWDSKKHRTKRWYVDGGAEVARAFRQAGARTALYHDGMLHFDDGSSVKAPPSLIGIFGMRRMAGEDADETDTEGKFEKGKNVPLSQLPEALQDNAENPPASVRELKDKMEGKKAAWDHLKDATVKRAELDLRTLGQLIEMDAESSEYPRPRDARVTPEVKRAADKFTRSLSKALSVYVQKYPTEDGSDVDDLMDAEAAYLTFMSFEGSGVGLWDGRWDQFFDDIDSLEKFLERALNREYYALKRAIEDAAYETTGGEELD